MKNDFIELKSGDAAIVFKGGENAVDLVLTDFDESKEVDATGEQVLATFVVWILENKTLELQNYIEEFIKDVSEKRDCCEAGACRCGADTKGKRKNGTCCSKSKRGRKTS